MGTVIRIAPCAQFGCRRCVKVSAASLCGHGEAGIGGRYGCALVFCPRHFGAHLCRNPRCDEHSDDVELQWRCDLRIGHRGPHSICGQTDVFDQPDRLPPRPALRLVTC